MKVIKKNREYRVQVAIKWRKRSSLSIDMDVPCTAPSKIEAMATVKQQALLKVTGYRRLQKGLNLFGPKQYQVDIALMDVQDNVLHRTTAYVEANAWFLVKRNTRRQYYLKVVGAHMIKGNDRGKMHASIST